MLATGTRGHFAFSQTVEGSRQERLAVTNHVGLICQSVTNQIPACKCRPEPTSNGPIQGHIGNGYQDEGRFYETMGVANQDRKSSTRTQ